YGLVSYLYTQDLNRAFRVSEALEAGMVGLNQGVVSNPAAPFGGVKHSGMGREGGKVGIEEFLETKYVGIGGLWGRDVFRVLLQGRTRGPSFRGGFLVDAVVCVQHV